MSETLPMLAMLIFFIIANVALLIILWWLKRARQTRVRFDPRASRRSFKQFATAAREGAEATDALVIAVAELTRQLVAAHASVHPGGEQYCDWCRPIEPRR